MTMMHFRCLLLAKIVSIYTRFQCIKFFRPKIGPCKLFDKFQVCMCWSENLSGATFYAFSLSGYSAAVKLSCLLSCLLVKL